MDDFVVEPAGGGKIKLSVQAKGTIVSIEVGLDQVPGVLEAIRSAAATSQSWAERDQT